jgi:hypothetical protein
MKNSDLAGVELQRPKPGAGRGIGPYAAWHRTCGHAVAIHADRSSVESMIQSLRGSGRFALRIRIATRDDVEGCARGITCNICRGLA